MKAETLFEKIGKRVRSRRGFLRKTQREVASQIGMHTTQYGKFERGEQELFRLDQLYAMAQYLQTTTDYLLTLSDEPDPQKPSRPEQCPGEALCLEHDTPRPVTLVVCLESANA